MLSFEFEEYELIVSQKELWILESNKDVFDNEILDEIREKLEIYLDLAFDDVNTKFDEGYLILNEVNKKYGDFLLIYLNNKLNNIKLSRWYLDDGF